MRRTRTIKAYDLEAGNVIRLDNGGVLYFVRAVEGTSLEDACVIDEISLYLTLLSSYYHFPRARRYFSFILRLPRMAKVRCDS